MPRPILVEIIGDETSLNRALTKSSSSVSKFGSTTEKSAKKTGILTSGIVKLGATIGAVFAAQKLVSFAEGAVHAAESVEKSGQAIRAEYGKQSDAVIQFADNAAHAFGVSKQASQDFAAQLGLQGRSMGLSTKQAAEQAIGYQKLAGAFGKIRDQDPASFYSALSKAQLGNTRGLKNLGIALTPVREKEVALQLGIKGSTSAWTAAQKAQIIYAIATRHLPQLLDQAGRHSNDLANRQRQLGAVWDNLQVTIGEKLLPVLTRLANWIANNTGTVKTIGIVVAGVTAAFLAYSAATAIATIATEGFTVALLANPVGAIAVGVVALATAMVIAYQRSKRFQEIVQSALHAVSRAVDFVRQHWQIFVALIPSVGPLILLIATHFNTFKSIARGALRVVAATIDFVRSHWRTLVAAIPVVGPLISVIASHFSTFRSIATKAVQGVITIVGKISSAVQRAASAASGPLSSIAAAFQKIVGWVQSLVSWISRIHWPSPPSFHIPGTAKGGIVTTPQVRLIGEAGPEAVIPLRRLPSIMGPAVGGGGGQIVVQSDVYLDGVKVGQVLRNANTDYKRHTGRDFF